MATRENQGLFIAVILLVLLTVVLAVATFFGYSGMAEAKDQHASAQTQLDTTKKQADGFESAYKILMGLLGAGDVTLDELSTYEGQLASAGNSDLADNIASARNAYDSDMNSVAAFEDGTEANYRKAIEALKKVVESAHQTSATMNNRIKDAQVKLQTEIAAKDKQLEEKQTLLDAARENLITEQQNHAQTRLEYKSRLDVVERTNKEANSSISELTAALDTERTRYRNDIEARDATILEKETRIVSLTTTETDVADGKIILARSGLGKVIINLGYDDNLRLKQTFAVYDKSAPRFRSGHGKATIEITNVLDRHMAEARITSQDATDPIQSDDAIVTATWDPGYSVPVALVGRVDLDGDGVTDMQRLISIVEGTGYGRVVAYHDDEGNVVGEIDENTRYFVKAGNALGKARRGFNQLDKQRAKYQTRTISVQEFLNEMGWTNEARIRKFDENVKDGPADTGFQPRQPGTQVEQGDPFETGGN